MRFKTCSSLINWRISTNNMVTISHSIHTTSVMILLSLIKFSPKSETLAQEVVILSLCAVENTKWLASETSQQVKIIYVLEIQGKWVKNASIGTGPSKVQDVCPSHIDFSHVPFCERIVIQSQMSMPFLLVLVFNSLWQKVMTTQSLIWKPQCQSQNPVTWSHSGWRMELSSPWELPGLSQNWNITQNSVLLLTMKTGMGSKLNSGALSLRQECSTGHKLYSWPITGTKGGQNWTFFRQAMEELFQPELHGIKHKPQWCI